MISIKHFPLPTASCAARAFRVLATAILLCTPAAGVDVRATIEVGDKPTWDLPTAEKAREEAFKWLETSKASPELRKQLHESWSQPGHEDDVLDRLASTFAAIDPKSRELVELCSQPRKKAALPVFYWLTSAEKTSFERNHLRLYYGRWLARARLYDEARDQLSGLNPEEVLDPATLLFYQALVYHQLLDQQPGLSAATRLLERSSEIPKRYASLARLIEADLSALEEDNLDHIARRMGDIERRLDLGHAGPKVRKVEDGVIESLDKLIKDLEDQQQQASAAARGQQIAPSAPAQQSRPLEGKGPGQVAQKNIGSKSGWGDLPPKQRQEALQQIGKEYPAHYREVIEQYFRKLAAGERGSEE